MKTRMDSTENCACSSECSWIYQIFLPHSQHTQYTTVSVSAKSQHQLIRHWILFWEANSNISTVETIEIVGAWPPPPPRFRRPCFTSFHPSDIWSYLWQEWRKSQPTCMLTMQIWSLECRLWLNYKSVRCAETQTRDTTIYCMNNHWWQVNSHLSPPVVLRFLFRILH